MAQENSSSVQLWIKERVGSVKLPLDPELLEVYIAESLHERGNAATLEAVQAVGFPHDSLSSRAPKMDACLSLLLKEIEGAEDEIYGVPRVQSLRFEELEKIERTAFIARLVPDGTRMETDEEARQRGCEDIALFRLQYWALLRLGELLDVRFDELQYSSDKSHGVLHLNSTSRWTSRYLFVPIEVMKAVEDIKSRDSYPGDNLFDMTQIEALHRIKRAGVMAELGEGLSGQSARIGMTQDLLAAGMTLADVREDGNWFEHSEMFIYCIKDMPECEAVETYYGKEIAFPTIGIFEKLNRLGL